MSKEKLQGFDGAPPEDRGKSTYRSPEPRYRTPEPGYREIKGPLGEHILSLLSEKNQEVPSDMDHSETINYSPETWRMLQEIEKLSGEGRGEAMQSALRLYYEKLLQNNKHEG